VEVSRLLRGDGQPAWCNRDGHGGESGVAEQLLDLICV